MVLRGTETCHRPGQIAPMSFLTYQSVRPWAKAMKAFSNHFSVPTGLLLHLSTFLCMYLSGITLWCPLTKLYLAQPWNLSKCLSMYAERF